MMRELRTVVITGATSGIGRNMALYFADKGYKVIGTGRDTERITALQEELDGFPAPGRVFQVDVRRYEEMKELVSHLESELGTIHVWINNAGVNRAIGPTWEADPVTWADDVDINLLGTFYGVHAIVPMMLRQGFGRIINLIGGGTTHAMKHSNAYGTAKTAVARFTENLAEELDETGAPIKVFALNPGLNDSEMTRALRATPEGKRYFPDMEEWIRSGAANPQEAPACAYKLAEGLADQYHGRMVTIYDSITEASSLEPDQYKLRMQR
ncbi:SDR family oxidoreductase [Paenibacillus sp. B01]|uniref:SDR family oxidoreductase n=1 Tax=Paenibacillus sp. B01 TaxID=2660554 RepID=UPI00129B3542|nr:SDR family NAD(P)-dependent oxidoreductase [Paenibacillus sp. B01]QGG56431.1 SDR family NAD(P)-dependent oxidoreductase [Paenibacillus sp. B01]